MTHDPGGVGAEQVVLIVRAMGSDDNQIGVYLFRRRQELLVDRAVSDKG